MDENIEINKKIDIVNKNLEKIIELLEGIKAEIGRL